MCGIISWNGSTAPDMNKLKILGICNEERGIHSSGYFYNKQISRGIGEKEQAKFRHLIDKYPLIPVEGANIFIGHMRHATFGLHTLENAHPFFIDNKLVIVHNGTLKNHLTLCKKYGIDTKDITVDSLALGHLLLKEGHKVLEEYEGAAAIILHKVDEPDITWVYHGASKVKPDEEEKEERPMFMLKTATGIYFSSLRYALRLIQENGEEISIVPHNQLLTINKGEINYESSPFIHRGNVNVEYPKVFVPKKTEVTGFVDYSKCVKQSPSQVVSDTEKGITPKIWYESTPNKACSGDDLVFFHKGRYWQTVELAAGTETKICDGILNIGIKNGFILPLDVKDGILTAFYHGIMLRKNTDYKKIVNDTELQERLKTLNFASIISRYSKYPVTNLEDESTTILPEYRYLWYKDGKREKSSFTPKYSNRTYSFKDGILWTIQCDDHIEYPLFKDAPEYKKKKEPVITPYKMPEKDKEKLLDMVSKEYKFFQSKWSDTALIYMTISDVATTALREYIRDAHAQLSDVELFEAEIGAEVDKIFDSAVLDDLSIEDCLPKTGNLLTYIEDAVQLQNDLKRGVDEIIRISDKKEVSTDFEYDKSSGMWLPKDLSEDNNTVPFPLDKRADVCPECGGIGISTIGKCETCDGSGLVEKKLSQGALFEDTELNFYANSKLEEPIVSGEDGKAEEIVSGLILEVKDLESSYEDLDELKKSEFALGLVNSLKPIISMLKRRIISLGWKYNFPNLVKQLDKTEKVC